MTQKHYQQHGTFHVTTNTKGKVPWLVLPGVPEVLMDNLMMTKNLYRGKLFAFCILPNHMHIITSPGERGLSEFMDSFKGNSSRDIRRWIEHGIFPHRSGASGGSATVGVSILTKCTRGQCIDTVVQRPSFEHPSFTGWQKGFYDEHLRDAVQRFHALRYVRNNAYSHHLVSESADWPWTSLHFPHLLDPMEIWFH